MIIAELQVKTSSGKKTPNCANCDKPAYFKFHWENYFLTIPNLQWRKCANCMSYEEREAVRRFWFLKVNMEL